MRYISALVGLVFALFATGAVAQLVPFTDFDISEEIWEVTTVKVDPNMGNDYLEGIKATWAASNDVAIELGQIEEYSIYRSDLPQSGDFNLLLVVKLKSTADLAPSKERYEAFIKKWGEERQAKTREIVKDYPGMREITGQYQMRKITLK